MNYKALLISTVCMGATSAALAGPACDVNNDGVTNVNDVQLSVNQVLRLSACTADINQDGQCTVVDVQRVVNAVLSGQCLTPTSGTTLLFDDFLGTAVDPAKWTVFNRLSDQVNGEVNCVTPQNISVSGGLLAGVSKFEDHVCGDSVEAPKTMHYTSWQIQQATTPFLYGTIEVRAKIPGGIGIWPCIWMLGYKWQASQPFTANTPEHNWPHDGWAEIDIAEFMANSRTTVNNQVHFESANVGPGIKNLPFNATSQFAVYRLQWSAGSMIWSVDAEDGKGFQTTSTLTGSNVPNVPMYVVLNAAIGGIGGGTPDPRTFPQTFLVDYVRVTQ
jgi:beta-glucanase (GH16 family)